MVLNSSVRLFVVRVIGHGVHRAVICERAMAILTRVSVIGGHAFLLMHRRVGSMVNPHRRRHSRNLPRPWILLLHVILNRVV